MIEMYTGNLTIRLRTYEFSNGLTKLFEIIIKESIEKKIK